MGLSDKQEQDRLSGVPIGGYSGKLSQEPGRAAECHDCGQVSDESEIASDNDGNDACPACLSTRLRWFETGRKAEQSLPVQAERA